MPTQPREPSAAVLAEVTAVVTAILEAMRRRVPGSPAANGGPQDGPAGAERTGPVDAGSCPVCLVLAALRADHSELIDRAERLGADLIGHVTVLIEQFFTLVLGALEALGSPAAEDIRPPNPSPDAGAPVRRYQPITVRRAGPVPPATAYLGRGA